MQSANSDSIHSSGVQIIQHCNPSCRLARYLEFKNGAVMSGETNSDQVCTASFLFDALLTIPLISRSDVSWVLMPL